MSENMKVYDAVRTVPPTAKKEIKGGRMSGKTDINPMWRIKALTEQFGMCGVGWKYEILNERLESAGEQVAAFVKINLYVKVDGAWSDGIPGTGGNMFVTKEKSGLHVSDECFKMALTDAISVACKALGFGADVYWDKDNTKYTSPQGSQGTIRALSDAQINRAYAIASSKGIDKKAVNQWTLTKFKKEISQLTKTEYDELCKAMEAQKNIEKKQKDG